MVIDVPSRGVQSDWMSVKIETELEWFRFSSSQPINICMALSTLPQRSTCEQHLMLLLW